MRRDQIATDVVHRKMTMVAAITWILEAMDLMAVHHQDGKPVTGFALGNFTSSIIFCFSANDRCLICLYTIACIL